LFGQESGYKKIGNRIKKEECGTNSHGIGTNLDGKRLTLMNRKHVEESETS